MTNQNRLKRGHRYNNIWGCNFVSLQFSIGICRFSRKHFHVFNMNTVQKNTVRRWTNILLSNIPTVKIICTIKQYVHQDADDFANVSTGSYTSDSTPST